MGKSFLRKTILLGILLCVLVWVWHLYFPRLGLALTTVKGIVTANSRGCDNDLNCYLAISMPGKPEVRATYEEFWQHCAYSPSLAKMLPGALVKVRGHDLGYTESTFFGNSRGLDICRAPGSQVSVLSTEEIADTDICSDSIRKSSEQINYVCNKFQNKTSSKDDLSALFFSLGELYVAGKIMPQDYMEAAKWYRLSAGYGNAEAQSKLGHLYFDGHIRPWAESRPKKEPIYAYEFLSLALKSRPNKEDETTRDEAASEINPSVLKDIQRYESSNWKITFPK
jgi:hypothetical protein